MLSLPCLREPDFTAGWQPEMFGSVKVKALTAEDQHEVLAFLAERSLHTIFMTGFIRDNGLVSPLNRGTFYACRNEEGHLEGVSLIGHATLIETRSSRVLEAFARLAREYSSAHVIMAEQEKVEDFWHNYSETGQPPRVVCQELMFEQRWPVQVNETVHELRQATLEDLDLVAPVQAEMAFEESGVNPLEKDPEGFRRRYARRIEQGRVWVLVENERLIFKTDVISTTAEVTYLEGVYVNPQDRGQGYGLRCLSQLGRTLLTQTESIVVLVNQQNQKGIGLYRKAGYRLRGYYDTIFLGQKESVS